MISFVATPKGCCTIYKRFRLVKGEVMELFQCREISSVVVFFFFKACDEVEGQRLNCLFQPGLVEEGKYWQSKSPDARCQSSFCFLCICTGMAAIWSSDATSSLKSCWHKLVCAGPQGDSQSWRTMPLLLMYVCVYVTHYAAESLSWYSRERLKQAWTPPSFHRRLMTPASSPVMKPSSAEPASTNSCRASSWERRRGEEEALKSMS